MAPILMLIKHAGETLIVIALV